MIGRTRPSRALGTRVANLKRYGKGGLPREEVPCLPAELADTLKRVSETCKKAFTAPHPGPPAATV